MNPVYSVYTVDKKNVASIVHRKSKSCHQLLFEYTGHRRTNTRAYDTGCEQANTAVEIVLYQKGLTALHRPRQAGCWAVKQVFSEFSIRSGSRVAAVPLRAFLEMPEGDDGGGGLGMFLPPCDRCKSAGCESCMGDALSTKMLFILQSLDPRGVSFCRVFVAFEDHGGVLTPVPEHFCKRLMARAQDGWCLCGRCRHPLKRYLISMSTVGARSFQRRMVNLFIAEMESVLHAAACEEADQWQQRFSPIVAQPPKPDEEAQTPRKRRLDAGGYFKHQSFDRDGVCDICYEDRKVARTCVHEKCNMEMCSQCHLKMRGMCAVCDRSKISGGKPFMCHGCKDLHEIESFGYACVLCHRPALCVECYDSYCMCSDCQANVLWHNTAGQRKE